MNPDLRDDASADCSNGLQSLSATSRTSASVSSVSVSEIAGQRLYQNALDTQKKIEDKAKERSKIHKPTLNLATRGRRSREPSPKPGTPPRYIQLYKAAKQRKEAEDVAEFEEKLDFDSVNQRDVTPTRNASCERLYSLSAQKQQEGKERRMEIMKAKTKPPLPDSHYKKITASEASKLYDRGMKHLISLEMKRMEAAFEMEEAYVSPLVPNSLGEENFASNE